MCSALRFSDISNALYAFATHANTDIRLIELYLFTRLYDLHVLQLFLPLLGIFHFLNNIYVFTMEGVSRIFGGIVDVEDGNIRKFLGALDEHQTFWAEVRCLTYR